MIIFGNVSLDPARFKNLEYQRVDRGQLDAYDARIRKIMADLTSPRQANNGAARLHNEVRQILKNPKSIYSQPRNAADFRSLQDDVQAILHPTAEQQAAEQLRAEARRLSHYF